MTFLESSAVIGLRLGLLYRPSQSGASLLINPALPSALTLGRRQGFLGLLASHPRGGESHCGWEEKETEPLGLGRGCKCPASSRLHSPTPLQPQGSSASGGFGEMANRGGWCACEVMGLQACMVGHANVSA